MKTPLRCLLVEDSENDALLLIEALQQSGCEPIIERVQTAEAMRTALLNREWDVVFSDYSMPEFDAPSAFRVLRENKKEIPFIIVSGTIGEDTAVESLKFGADDYLLKHNLKRLVPAVERALKEKEEHRRTEQMEMKLRYAQKLEAIGQLAAGIAHEINTPIQYAEHNLRFIQESFVSLKQLLDHYQILFIAARAGNVTPELVQKVGESLAQVDGGTLIGEISPAIEEALQGTERIAKIVRAMKEFSHPGNKENPTAANLNHAIESTITVARNEWKYVAEMVMEFDSAMPPVPMFADEFNQVILNLLVNAAHAIESALGKNRRKGIITVSTCHDKGWAEVRVRDTGTGIPENIRHKIFEPFFTTKAVGKGTGQGLALAHSVIVERHRGELHFETEIGRGTCFIIRLPLNPPPEKNLKPSNVEGNSK